MFAYVQIASVTLTVLAYLACRTLHARFPCALFAPAIMASLGIALILATCGIDYATYCRGTESLVALLGPATAALAIPLYKHRRLILAYWLPAITGLICGSMTTLVAAVALAEIGELTPVLIRSFGIKSVTTPIAMELAPLVGGDPVLTVTLVVATGLLGATLGPWLLNRLGVKDPVARGLAFGTIAQGFGTAQAAAEGEIEGAVAGVAMGAAAVLVSFAAPLVIPVLLRVLR